MRRPQITQNIINAAGLNVGGVTPFRPEFPLGEGYFFLFIELIIALTVGTGTGAIAEGELQFLRNIYLRSDRDGIIVNSNGRGLFRNAESIFGTTPYKDAIAATNGTYRISIPIIFADPLLLRPNDLILDTSRYKNLEMYVTLGTVADLLTSPGTATVVCTLNATVIKSDGMLLPEEKPYALPYFAGLPPVIPNVLNYIDIERAQDLAIMNLLAFTTVSSTAGLPYSGVLDNAVITGAQIEDNFGFPVRNTPAVLLQQYNKLFRQVPTVPAGVYLFDFAKDGSILSAYVTGDKSKCQLNWTFGSGATPQITAYIKGYRTFKS